MFRTTTCIYTIISHGTGPVLVSHHSVYFMYVFFPPPSALLYCHWIHELSSNQWRKAMICFPSAAVVHYSPFKPFVVWSCCVCIQHGFFSLRLWARVHVRVALGVLCITFPTQVTKTSLFDWVNELRTNHGLLLEAVCITYIYCTVLCTLCIITPQNVFANHH